MVLLCHHHVIINFIERMSDRLFCACESVRKDCFCCSNFVLKSYIVGICFFSLLSFYCFIIIQTNNSAFCIRTYFINHSFIHSSIIFEQNHLESIQFIKIKLAVAIFLVFCCCIYLSFIMSSQHNVIHRNRSSSILHFYIIHFYY